MIASILIIWLIGAVISYLLLRYNIRKIIGEWTISDRIFAISISLVSSWIMVCIQLIEFIIPDENDNPASW